MLVVKRLCQGYKGLENKGREKQEREGKKRKGKRRGGGDIQSSEGNITLEWVGVMLTTG
jgi:hypothetical protein